MTGPYGLLVNTLNSYMKIFFDFVLCTVALMIGLALIEKQVDPSGIDMVCNGVGLLIILRVGGFLWEKAGE